jgi:hypothetical protein
VVRVVTDVSSNQLAVPYYPPYVWPALKKKIPFAFNHAVHLFLLKYSPNPRLVKDINYGFKLEVEETLLFLSQCHSILPFIPQSTILTVIDEPELTFSSSIM